MNNSQNPIQQLKDWYLLSKRRQVTFQKLYEHPYFNKSQIEQLKTAQALYEIIPISIYVPYLIIMTRQAAKATSANRLLRFGFITLISMPLVELSAMYSRDRYYWPIVRELYLEVKSSNKKINSNPFSMFQNLASVQQKQPEDYETREKLEKYKDENEGYKKKFNRVWSYFITNNNHEQIQNQIDNKPSKDINNNIIKKKKMESVSLWEMPVNSISGKSTTNLSDYIKDKKCIIIVNVASECGLTESNYTQLTEIYKTYKDQGLEILGFPCNQFGAQEPGSSDDIFKFVCETYKADFPLFEKVDVNGPNTHPVYQYLKSQSSLNDGSTVKDISWNFAKFIVQPDGKVVKYAEPDDEPKTLIPIIENMIGIKNE